MLVFLVQPASVISARPQARDRDMEALPEAARGSLVVSPEVPTVAAPSEIAGLVISSTSGADLHGQPVTFGQVFEEGKLPSTASIALKTRFGIVPAQLDVKAKNSDGSVRMGVVSAVLPLLPAQSALAAVILVRPRAAASEIVSAVRDKELLVDVSVHGGGRHRIALSQLLQREIAHNRPAYWLRGPIAAEYRIDAPVEGSLHVVADLRRYFGGNVWSDLAFRNDYAFQKTGGPITYDLLIRSGDTVLFARNGISQLQYTTWHKVFDRGQDAINVVHDVRGMERAGAIIDYELSVGVPRNLIDRNAREMAGPGFDILQNAGLAFYMPMTGGRNDIGITTRANTMWLITQDPQARAYALAQADAAGSIPWHFFEPTTNTFATAAKRPRLWLDERASKLHFEAVTQPLPLYTKGCNCFYVDAAHQPDLSFVPYIMTGLHYYLDQLEAQTTWDILDTAPPQRKFGAGLVIYPDTQLRREAWSLRNILNASWIAPDDDPLKAYFGRMETANMGELAKWMRAAKEGEAAGWFPGTVKAKFAGGINPYQEDYMAFVIALAAKRRTPEAEGILKWQTNFLAGRFLAADKGFPPAMGTMYHLYTFAPPDPMTGAYKTWAEIAKATTAREPNQKGSPIPYVVLAKGALAQIYRITGSARAKSAYSVLESEVPGANLRKEEMDPTWFVTLSG